MAKFSAVLMLVLLGVAAVTALDPNTERAARMVGGGGRGNGR